MAAFSYPSASELKKIEQVKLPNLMKNRKIFDIMPIRTANVALLMWEQKDNYTGLQQHRGMNGKPSSIKKPGAKRYTMSPGYYGEFADIDEEELTLRRSWGSFNDPISIDDLVMEAQDLLLQRRLDRIEKIGWDLLQTGTFSVADRQGRTIHTDQFPLQTYSAVVPWTTVATSEPLKDFRNVQLLSRGKSTSFAATAKAYMNRTTLNTMLSNTNANDLAGRRTSGLLSVLTHKEINSILAGEDLPQIEVYDEGYLDDAGNFQLWIANNKVIVVGSRPSGQSIAEYRMTRNANNTGMAPGPYSFVVDNQGKEVPRNIRVHDGHNGGPVIFFPGSIVIMTVGA